MEAVIWVGIAVCLMHSAMFSGLNLAFFSLSRLRLEAEAGPRLPDFARTAERIHRNFLTLIHTRRAAA